MNLNDAFHGISTIIETESTVGREQGTGFFYSRLSPTEKEGPQWRQILAMWIVTNRHVVVPTAGETELRPARVTFNLRKYDEGSGWRWVPLTLEGDELEKRLRFHRISTIDIATIDVNDLVLGPEAPGSECVPPFSVKSDNFAGRNNIDVEASSDVLVVGYPRGFYDTHNLYPIIKSGIVASRWGVPFEGKPYFLVDAKLFPGSSGSVVVSKPTDLVVRDGKVLHSSEKQFALLGVFSGEPFLREAPIELETMTIIQKAGFNLGVVWYAELIEDILDDGAELSEAVTT